MKMLNIALPKGRLGEKAYGMFERAGYPCPSIKENNRKLIFENEAAGVRYFWVKPSDVAIYVERGAADLGIVGKDILLEYAPDVYELLDLGMGKCRMAVAAKKSFHDDRRRALIGTIVSFSSKSFSLSVVPVSTISTITSDSDKIGASSIEPFRWMMSMARPCCA